VEAIDAFIKAQDPNSFSTVISVAENENESAPLVKYLVMARSSIKNSIIDNALAFAYARLDKLSDLEELISGPNSVDAQLVGDRCFNEKLYESARILF